MTISQTSIQTPSTHFPRNLRILKKIPTSPSLFHFILQTIMKTICTTKESLFVREFTKCILFYIERCKVKDRQLRKVRFGWESSSIFFLYIFISSSFFSLHKKKFSKRKKKWAKNVPVLTKIILQNAILCDYSWSREWIKSREEKNFENFILRLWFLGERRKTFFSIFFSQLEKHRKNN